MAERWKGYVDSIHRNARRIHEIATGLVPLLDMRIIAQLATVDEPAPAGVTVHVWDFLSEGQRSRARLAEGHCGDVRHKWIVVEFTDIDVAEEDRREVLECVSLPYRFIVDPCCRFGRRGEYWLRQFIGFL